MSILVRTNKLYLFLTSRLITVLFYFYLCFPLIFQPFILYPETVNREHRRAILKNLIFLVEG